MTVGGTFRIMYNRLYNGQHKMREGDQIERLKLLPFDALN